MKILLSWLREFVPLTAEPQQLAKDLAELGFAVDAISTEGGETVLEIDVTTNRPDCLSHYGIARELAARYGLPLAPLDPQPSAEAAAQARPRARRKDGIVEIAAADLCARYSARLIRGVRPGPSPDWMVRRLTLLGLRSINNVADATNYVLMAFGHPMHAFDLDKLEGGRIIVRRAAEGESLTTLDGVQRTLTSDDLVIADARRPVALAGVMGGQDSEISADTRNVLLESAWFDRVTVRRTAKRHGLHTEASHRFERGADIEATVPCAGRCTELIQQLAGGEPDPHFTDAYAKPLRYPPIVLRPGELLRHLGLEIPAPEVQQILLRLGFSPKPKGRAAFLCQAPSYRVDVSREIDLIEEVARHYGYDRFPTTLPANSGTPAHRAANANPEDRVREWLLALGYDEAITSPLVSAETEQFGTGPLVELSNPLSEQAAVLRPSLTPNLLAALQWNVHRGQQSVALFEIGKSYRRGEAGFLEAPAAALAATGERLAGTIAASGRGFSFSDIKGDVEAVLELFDTEPGSDDQELPAYFRPGQGARLLLNGKVAAQVGQLHPQIAESWKFRHDVFIAEIFLQVLYARGLRRPRAHPVSRYPAVERDFSVVLPEGTPYAAVRQAVASLGLAEMVGIQPVEIFRGSPVPAGFYSLLLRVVFQSDAATLTEADLAERSARVIETLEQRLDATIRMSG